MSTELTGGIYVPAYSRANFPAIIAQMDLYPAIEWVIAINPNSGRPTSRETVFVSMIKAVEDRSQKCIGYCPTGYLDGANPQRTVPGVKALIDNWRVHYPEIKGFMFDEGSNRTDRVGGYADISDYANNGGQTYNILNTGTDTPITYYPYFDVISTREGTSYDQALQQTVKVKDKEKVVIYAVPLDILKLRALLEKYRMIYLTNDGGNNPYDQLPTYWAQECLEVDKFFRGRTITRSITTTTNGIKSTFNITANSITSDKLIEVKP